jgi:predicted ATPase
MLIRAAVQRAGGREVDTQGDAFFFTFPGCGLALKAAVDIQTSLAQHDWPEGADLTVRLGVHSGEVRVRPEGYVGMDVHRAARIAAAAHGGQIIVSAVVRELARTSSDPSWRFDDLGEHRLKGLERSERLYQLSSPGLRTSFPPLRSLDSRPNNLPVRLNEVIGRKAEVQTVRELMGRSRLVTLTGPGGGGKTSLALEVAASTLHEFADGVWFVPLAAVSDATLVASTIATRLGVRDQGPRSVTDLLQDQLRDKAMLLILDNFEHVLPAAPMVTILLADAPDLRILVTSRATLRVDGEQEFLVPPLSLTSPANGAEREGPAVELFRQRARAADPTFEVIDSNVEVVTDICRRLEGLPLAIELAAQRTKLLHPQELLRKLDNRLAVLTGGGRDRPERHRTLRDTIAWSYELLDESKRAMFRRLSVFRGGWTLDTAEEVCNPGSELGLDTLELIGSLLDESLINRQHSEGPQARFGMLETIREFALDELMKGQESPLVARRHADLFLRLAESSEAELIGPDQVRYLDLLEAERDNLRSVMLGAIKQNRAQLGLRIAGAIWRFWHLRGHFTEGRLLLDELLAASSDVPGGVKAKALTAAGGLAYWQRDYVAARHFYEEALAIRRRLGRPSEIAESLYNLGFLIVIGGETDRAQRLYEESRELYSSIDDGQGEAYALSALGVVADVNGEFEEARELVQDSLTRFELIEDTFGQLNSLTLLGRLSHRTGRFDEAHLLLNEAIEAYAEVGNHSGLAWALNELAHLELDEGRVPHAVAIAAGSCALSEKLGAEVPASLIRVPDIRSAAASQISPEEVSVAWAEGFDRSLRETVDFALGHESAQSHGSPATVEK